MVVNTPLVLLLNKTPSPHSLNFLGLSGGRPCQPTCGRLCCTPAVARRGSPAQRARTCRRRPRWHRRRLNSPAGLVCTGTRAAAKQRLSAAESQDRGVQFISRPRRLAMPRNASSSSRGMRCIEWAATIMGALAVVHGGLPCRTADTQCRRGTLQAGFSRSGYS